MFAKEQVRDYIHRVRRRLRVEAGVRGMALCGLAALLLTVILVLLANAWRFSEGAVRMASIALWAGVGLALALFLVRPLLRRLGDVRIARFVEEVHPELRDRLVTAVDLAEKPPRDGNTQVFRDLVAEDALAHTASVPPNVLIEPRRILRPLLWAAASVAMILVLGFFGPGVFRYGTRVLWVGWAQAKVNPLYQIRVSPGDLVVGRNSDQEIIAQPSGFHPETVRLFALYAGSPGWESAPMLPEERGGSFQFLFLNIREGIQYYVEANGVRSPQYRISVIEVPRVERLEVRYDYPAYTGMEDTVEPAGGDIVALRGTKVTLVAHTDAPASGGRMVLDDGTDLSLEKVGERQLQASWTLSKDSLYHIRLRDHLDREARASEEYLIQALHDSPPTVRLTRPGHDLQPTPVEEVVTGFEAQDDVRLAELQMRYSVNGGSEQSVALARGGQERDASGDHTLMLENFKLVPGDLITFYGVAKDAAANSTQTEMYFLQVRPFERSYTQGQAAGGGGGGGQESTFLSERQKELIAATWNVIRKKGQQRPDQVAEATQVLSSVQRSLREQAETLASRVSRRELGGVNEEFSSLVENLQKAVQAMEPAADLLGKQKFQDALSPEQTALQRLLRAEAMYRDIQVAFGNQGGGGGSAGNSGRDLADLFALELDTNKNQYETLREMSSSQNNTELDEALRKLEELARRQEDLSRQERENQKESLRAASRWEQEMLRREAEELARRLEQLSRETNSSQIGQAGQRLSQAARDMEQAGSQSGSSGSSEQARALERLREASDLLSGQRNRSEEETMRRLAENADQLARQQQKIAEDTRQVAEGKIPQGGTAQRPSPRSAQSEREMFSQTLDEKIRQLESLRALERQMNEAAARMAANQKKAAQKLRGASSSIQEERMADKIRQGAWLAQRGMWPTAVGIEEDLRADLERLAERVRDAQRSLRPGGSEDKLREALAAAERVRQGLESLERRQSGSESPSGQQPGNQGGPQGSQQAGHRGDQQGQAGRQRQPGQQGQPGSETAPGNQAGGTRDPRMFGSPSATRRDGLAGTFTGRYRGEAWNPGDVRPSGPIAPLTPEEQRQLEERSRELRKEAAELRALLAEDPEFDKLARDLVQSMQNLDWKRFPGNPEELERLRARLVDQWKELELRLSRQLQLDKSDAVRLAGQERVPERYRSILEEYYRSLSRSHR